MTIINRLQQERVLITQRTTGRLGVDLDQDGSLQNNEIIPDDNKNGKADLREVLDFIVNNVTSMPTIEIVKNIITINDENPLISTAVKKDYLPKLDLLEKEIQVKEEKLDKLKLQQLIEKYNFLQAEENKAVSTLDHSKLENIKKQKIEICQKMKELGRYIPEVGPVEITFDKPTKIRLPNNIEVFVSFLHIPENSDAEISKILLSEPTRLELPNKLKALVSALELDIDGQINEYFLTENTKMTFPNELEGEVVAVKFNDLNKITCVSLATPIEATLPIGKQGVRAAVSFITFDNSEEIIAVNLSKPLNLTLPNGVTTTVNAVDFSDRIIRSVSIDHSLKMPIRGGESLIFSARNAVYFNGAGDIVGEMYLEGKQKATLPNGSTALIEQFIIFDDSGKIKKVDLAEPAALLLPNNIEAIVRPYYEGIKFNENGKIIGEVVLDKPIKITVPTGEAILVSSIIFNDNGEISSVVAVEKASVLINGASTEISPYTRISFDDNGAISSLGKE